MFSEAQLYSDASFLQQRKAFAMVDSYRGWLKSNPKDIVLDVGSGPGIITEKLPSVIKQFSRIVGVDVSKEMVNHARSESRDRRISYYRMDITAGDRVTLRQHLPLELREAKFDKVFCFYLLHWLAGKFNLALENLEYLMAPGGQGMSIQYISIPVFDTYVVIGQYNKWSPYLQGKILDYNPLRTARDPVGFMKSAVTNAGLVADDISTYSSHNVYHSISDIIGLMTSIDPFLQYIPGDLHSDYMEDFMNALLPKCRLSNDGSIGIPFTIMTCAFSKPSI